MSAAGAATITNWNTHNNPTMRLEVNVSPTMTTGIKIATPQKNGDDYTIPTTTGGVLRMRRGTFFEDIYFSTGAVASDGVMTLYGVIRNICPQYHDRIVTCGDGEQFYAGDVIETNIDARLINWKMNVNTDNTCTSSGCISFSGSGSLYQPNFATATIRDRQLGTNPREGSISCLDSTGQCYDWKAGAWRSRSGSNIINATESAAGKVQLASTGALLSRTATGSTGAFDVIQAKHVTMTGGTANQFRVPLLDWKGTVVTRIGGTGSGSLNSGSILLGNGTNAFKTLNLTSGAGSGGTIRATGTAFAVVRQPVTMLNAQSVVGSQLGVSTTAEQNLYQFAFSGASLKAGDTIKVQIGCRTKFSSGPPILRVRAGTATGTVIVDAQVGTWQSNSADAGCSIDATLVVGVPGASGTIGGSYLGAIDNNIGATTNENPITNASASFISVTGGLAGSVRITVTIQFGASNANNYFQLTSASAFLYARQ